MYTPEVNTTSIEVLSDNWYTLRKVTFALRQKDGRWSTQSREAYDRGNGAAILLYNPGKKTVFSLGSFACLPS